MATASDSKLVGGTVMALLFLGAVLLASIPLLAGVVVGALVPGIGGLRPGSGPGQLLHLLWIYPVLFLVATVVDGVGKYFRDGGDRSAAGTATELVVLWFAVTLMLTVFLEHPGGAALASAVAMLLYRPFVRHLERQAEEDEPEDDDVTGPADTG